MVTGRPRHSYDSEWAHVLGIYARIQLALKNGLWEEFRHAGRVPSLNLYAHR